MKVLLDENFPVQLYRRLLEAGYDAEHIIALGLRGVPTATSGSALRYVRPGGEAVAEVTELLDVAPGRRRKEGR